MGSNVDRVLAALEAGPMTAHQISMISWGDETHEHVCTIRRGLRQLMKYRLVEEIGTVTIGTGRRVVYNLVGHEVPADMELDGLKPDTPTRKETIMALLTEEGPMTVEQMTARICGDTERKSKDVMRCSVDRMRKEGLIDRCGKLDGSYLYEVKA